MSDFVDQTGSPLTDQLSTIARWIDETLIDLKGFYLFIATRLDAAWQLFLEDLSLVTNLFFSWLNRHLDGHHFLKPLIQLNNFETLMAAVILLLTAALFTLSIRAKTKRRYENHLDDVTFEEIVLAAGENKKSQEQQQFLEIERELAPTKSNAEKKMGDEATNHDELKHKQGFKFFKKTNRYASTPKSNDSMQDDVFLLGIEQEMLATRQLYLDGFISKEVYIAETRSLFRKAQTRMT